MKTIAIIGTLDTKGEEFRFLKERIESRGLATCVIDCGVVGDPAFEPDVGAAEVARLGGGSLEELRRAGDRGAAIRVMGQGAARKLQELAAAGRIHGAIGAGGSGNTSLAAAAMRDLPIGMPKLIVSTVASGDVSSYVGIKDVTMMFSVGDIEGLNQLTVRILNNAAGAIAGMVTMEAPARPVQPTVAVTMFGVTTPAVKAIRQQLEARGFEVLVFHATGSGGRAMETLVEQGIVEGVIDLTTTEIADEVVGGIFSAGPERLKAGVRKGIPQVIAPGALDMVNFGPLDTVPERFKGRNLYVHNPQVTLMRTTPEENVRFAELIAANLEGADPRRVTVCLPLKGFSAIDREGAVFADPEADRAFTETLKRRLASGLPVVEVDAHINDQDFVDEVVRRFLAHWEQRHA